MNPSDTTQLANAEGASEADVRLLQEWRQKALSQGIAPIHIDQYLFSQPDVPPEVKRIIQQESRGTAAQVNDLSQGFETDTPSVVGEATRTIETGGIGVNGPTIAGEVNVLDTRSQFEAIKREAFAGQAEIPSVWEGTAAIERAESQPQVQTQTMEQKELTTTQGTQNTASGVAVRESLGVSGYPISQQVVDNHVEIVEKGPVGDAKTWQAALIQRFIELWGSIQGLFSTGQKVPVSQ